MAQRIEVDGQCVAVLIHGDTGDYIVPPIALDQAGDMVMGEVSWRPSSSPDRLSSTRSSTTAPRRSLLGLTRS